MKETVACLRRHTLQREVLVGIGVELEAPHGGALDLCEGVRLRDADLAGAVGQGPFVGLDSQIAHRLFADGLLAVGGVKDLYHGVAGADSALLGSSLQL